MHSTMPPPWHLNCNGLYTPTHYIWNANCNCSLECFLAIDIVHQNVLVIVNENVLVNFVMFWDNFHLSPSMHLSHVDM